jgi:hypothetical protein
MRTEPPTPSQEGPSAADTERFVLELLHTQPPYCVAPYKGIAAKIAAHTAAAVERARKEWAKYDEDDRRGAEAIWNAVQQLSPWFESNEMDWHDEILCGLHGVASRIDELTTERDALTRQLAEREKELADNLAREERVSDQLRMAHLRLTEAEAQLADLQRSNGEAIETLRSLLFAVENADETGYVDGVGFIKDYDAIFERAHALTATPPPSAGASGKQNAHGVSDYAIDNPCSDDFK